MTRRSELAALVAGFADAQVMCLGDVMLDRFVHGFVERISPEAPVPVLHIDRETQMLGGAGNVARNLAALGARTSFLSVIGDDEAGHAVTALVPGLAGVEPMLIVDPDRQTTIKTRLFGGGQQLLRADRETVRPVSGRTLDRLVRRATAMVADCAAVILSDYAKGVLVPAVIDAVRRAASDAGVPVIVDPKGPDFRRYTGLDLLTPNRAELAAATGLPTDDDDQVATAALALCRDCEAGAVLATRGPEGMVLVTPGPDGGEPAITRLAAERREVFDVSGAGDTVVAVLAAALASGTGLADAAALANVAGGVVVGKTGTATVPPGEIVAALHGAELRDAEARVATVAEAAGRVEGWRRRGLRIGFTNGCFDLLHPGHVSLVAQARQACDRLVVAINGDASVARLKGPGRPVQSEAARAAVLASLADVDLVVVFAEDTPEALIDQLRPDVLVKGAEYRREDVVGGDLVESRGGRILLAEILDGYSTTGTIARSAGGAGGGDGTGGEPA